MAERTHVTAAELKQLWFSDDATGMIDDYQTGHIVVQMRDGTEYACTFEEHSAQLRGGS
jgi:hypothetical protein